MFIFLICKCQWHTTYKRSTHSFDRSFVGIVFGSKQTTNQPIKHTETHFKAPKNLLRIFNAILTVTVTVTTTTPTKCIYSLLSVDHFNFNSFFFKLHKQNRKKIKHLLEITCIWPHIGYKCIHTIHFKGIRKTTENHQHRVIASSIHDGE